MTTALRPNPYVGLRPFEQADSRHFFGRQHQTVELLDRLADTRFLAIVGSSGCGKSSLIRAGLIPALLAGFLVEDRDKWSIAVMKPGNAPTRNLAKALCLAAGDATGGGADALCDALVQDQSEAVIRMLEPLLGTDTSLLLLVDQFEEIFPFRGDEDDELLARLSPRERRARDERRAEAANFVDLLLSLPNVAGLPVFVVLTMRSDFTGDCDVFHGLPEAMNMSRYLVPRLTRRQLREAVEGPALLSGAAIAPRLLDTLLNDLGSRSDQLPVLQHALFRTWNAWRARLATTGKDAPAVDLTDYHAIGGLRGALAQHAEEALRRSDPNDMAVTAAIFKCLTDTDPQRRRVRRPTTLTELAEVSSAPLETVQAIIERFRTDGRHFLVVSEEVSGNARVDISHESLIRQWGQLRDWIDQEGASRDQYRDLMAGARNGRAPLRDPDLQLAVRWHAEVKPTPSWAARYSEQDGDLDAAIGYLRRGVEQKQRERRRLIGMLGLLFVAVILTGSLFVRARTAAAVAEAAQADAKAAQAGAKAAAADAAAARAVAAAQQAALEESTAAQDALKSVTDQAIQALKALKDKAADREAEILKGKASAGTSLLAQLNKYNETRLQKRDPAPSPPSIPPSSVAAEPVTAEYQKRLVTYSNVSLNGRGNVAQVAKGEKITVAFHWEGVTRGGSEPYCPNCFVQLYYGFYQQGEWNCFASDLMPEGWRASGDVKGILTAPGVSGTYYLTQSTSLQFTCREDLVKSPENLGATVGTVTVQ